MLTITRRSDESEVGIYSEIVMHLTLCGRAHYVVMLWQKSTNPVSPTAATSNLCNGLAEGIQQTFIAAPTNLFILTGEAKADADPITIDE